VLDAHRQTAVSLRNRHAVAEWLLARYPTDDVRVALICAGERWPAGTLRPAVEDLWGAGALADLLLQGEWRNVAPEAGAAAAAFRAVQGDVRDALRASASGRELIEAGYPGDVDVAAELDTSTSVPVLRDGAFVAE
jgi:2-phosphosulfolactate phosphatase